MGSGLAWEKGISLHDGGKKAGENELRLKNK